MGAMGNDALRPKTSGGKMFWRFERRSFSSSSSSGSSFCLVCYVLYINFEKGEYLPARNTRRLLVSRVTRYASSLTHEFAVDPKYFARPEMLMDNDPNASTTSGLCSSSFMEWLGDIRGLEGSLCNGAFIRSRSSVRSGCGSVESWEWEDLRESSRSRTRVDSSDIFSCSSVVDASTNLEDRGLETIRYLSEFDTYRLPWPVVNEPAKEDKRPYQKCYNINTNHLDRLPSSLSLRMMSMVHFYFWYELKARVHRYMYACLSHRNLSLGGNMSSWSRRKKRNQILPTTFCTR